MPSIGFVGASYVTPSIYQNDQECINFYPEIDPTKQPGEHAIVALYPTLGLTEEIQLIGGEVRGMRTLSGNQYLLAVCGNNVYLINSALEKTLVGALNTNVGIVGITDNITTDNGLTAYIVDGSFRYILVLSTRKLTVDTTGLWSGATSCDTVDNYIIYNQPDTQNWSATDLGLAVSNSGLYGAKDGSPDTLIALIADHRQVYLLGEFTTEVWVDVGNVIPDITTFPFQRISGTSMQHGCAAKYSIARFATSFMFVSKDMRGQAIVGVISGYEFQRVSTHAVENTLVNVDVSDAVAYSYQIEGHEFYVVTFPQIDLTWVYDKETQQWHKWLSWDSLIGYYRHRSNCGASFANKILVGDYQNGKIYSLNRNAFTDNGNPIRRLRRCLHLINDLKRQFFKSFQVQFQPGVGLDFGQGENPQAMLRWSDDGGSTWSNEHWTSIGKKGKYKHRALWRRLGFSRDRIFEVVFTDPVYVVIISDNLEWSTGVR